MVQKNIKEVMRKKGLVESPQFVQKVIQLYETSLVRHGFMLIGPSCSGKSTIRNILTEALQLLPESKKYVIQKLNPKAFTS